MPTFVVVVEGEFDNRQAAEEAMSDMEDAIGKNNGNLTSSKIEEED